MIGYDEMIELYMPIVRALKPGDKVKAGVPFMSHEPRTIHIKYVLDSIYEDRKLIVYAVYGKQKQWWHEIMCTDTEMCYYLERASK